MFAPCLSTPAIAAWTATGPYGGNAESLAVSPTDPQLILAGTKNANLFLSRNAGESWDQISFPRQYSAMLHTLLIDPRNPSVFYAAIADEARSGLYRSKDGGISWAQVAGLGNEEVYSLAIFHSDPKIMAVGLRSGVRVSRDGGETWKVISPADNVELTPVVSVAFDPKDSRVIYAGTPRLPWKTTDGGSSWNMIAEGMSTDSDIITVRVDAARPARVFIGACSGFWRSTNSGAMWAKMAGIPFTSRRTYAFVQDPNHTDTIFAGTSRGLYRTKDGGAEWKLIAAHEIKSLAMSGDALYIATADAGLFKSLDQGMTLKPINEGFTSRNFSPVSEAGEHIYTGTKFEVDAGSIYSSADGGRHWELIAEPSQTGYENVLSVVCTSAGTILAATQTSVLRSEDAGKTWTRVGATTPAPVKPAAHPKSASNSHVVKAKSAVVKLPVTKTVARVDLAGAHVNRLMAVDGAVLAATESGMYRSIDDGLNWSACSSTSEPVRSLMQSSGNVLALTSHGLLLSNDSGATWVNRHLPYFAEVYDVAAAGDIAIAGTSRGAFRSEDGGETWHAAQSGIPLASITAVAIDPVTQRLAFAFEYGNLYESNDAGRNWHHFDQEGLGGALVRSFAITTQAPRTLLAVTATRGIFIREIDEGKVPKSSVSAVELRKDQYVPNQQNDKTPAF